MNSAFVNPGIYSCAVDASLEISTHLVLPYLSRIRIRNEFTDLLFNICSHYTSSREDSSLLREIREPVWSYMIVLCSSFAATDCNACFSQIFEKRTFGCLNEEEENLFMTPRVPPRGLCKARIVEKCTAAIAFSTEDSAKTLYKQEKC